MSGQPPKQDGETRTYWRTAGTATVVVAVLSLIGVIVQARGDSSGPTAAPATTAGPVTTAGSSETIDSTTRPTEPRQGVLKLRVGEVAAGKWYPAAGQLPKDAPPDYDLGDWYFHCDKWAKWLIKRGAAPLGSDVVVGVTAPDSAPLTITQVEVQVFSKSDCRVI